MRTCMTICFATIFVICFLFAGPLAAQTPSISPGGVVNAADYSDALAPGLIISIYGRTAGRRQRQVRPAQPGG